MFTACFCIYKVLIVVLDATFRCQMDDLCQHKHCLCFMCFCWNIKTKWKLFILYVTFQDLQSSFCSYQVINGIIHPKSKIHLLTLKSLHICMTCFLKELKRIYFEYRFFYKKISGVVLYHIDLSFTVSRKTALQNIVLCILSLYKRHWKSTSFCHPHKNAIHVSNDMRLNGDRSIIFGWIILSIHFSQHCFNREQGSWTKLSVLRLLHMDSML